MNFVVKNSVKKQQQSSQKTKIHSGTLKRNSCIRVCVLYRVEWAWLNFYPAGCRPAPAPRPSGETSGTLGPFSTKIHTQIDLTNDASSPHTLRTTPGITPAPQISERQLRPARKNTSRKPESEWRRLCGWMPATFLCLMLERISSLIISETRGKSVSAASVWGDVFPAETGSWGAAQRSGTMASTVCKSHDVFWKWVTRNAQTKGPELIQQVF